MLRQPQDYTGMLTLAAVVQAAFGMNLYVVSPS